MIIRHCFSFLELTPYITSAGDSTAICTILENKAILVCEAILCSGSQFSKLRPDKEF
jgi:hypothetical protein